MCNDKIELDMDEVAKFMSEQPKIDDIFAELTREDKCANCGKELTDSRQSKKVAGMVTVCNHCAGAFNRMIN